jgi:nucleotide-binding universal stress UspA family protein
MSTLEQAVSVSFKNILLATDLSPASERALECARTLARDRSAVHTLHVSGSDNYQLLCPEAFSATFNTIQENGRGATHVLKELLKGLPCQVPVHGSRIWEVIADVTARNEIDLLILGTHGRRGLNKLLFGSVAEEVFRDVTCPVLTVGADAKTFRPSGFEIKNVLLASDFNPKSFAPIYAAWLSQRFDARFFGLHVVSSEDDWPNANCYHVEEQLVNMAPEIKDLKSRPEFMVEFGEPAAKILQVAGEISADIIVLGAHAPRDVRTVSHLPWATAGRVISCAPCPVLTVRDSWIR